MKWLVTFSLALLLLPTSALAETTRAPCAERGSVVRDASARVRVYETRQQALYACHIKTRRRVRLSEPPDDCLGGSCRSVELWVLRGDRIAWASSFGDEYSDASSIRIANLATGSRRTTSAVPRSSGHAYQRVTDLVVTRNATVAWISQAGTRLPDEGEERFVGRRRLSGSVEFVDTGLQIEAGSLAGADQRFYWMNSGAARYAMA